VNAAMLRKLYGEEEVRVPAELAATYRRVLSPLGIEGDGEPRLEL
jgi:hypothetical protein